MADKPILKIGHLKITDHLILGVTDLKLKKGMETFDHCTIQTVLKNGWNEVADALATKALDGALILAPTAMDLYKSGVGLKLLLLAHRSGSILVKNKRANIQKIEEFFLSKDLWPGHPCCVFVMRDEIIEKHPEAVQELTTSFVKSGLAIDAQPKPASAIGAEFLSQEKSVIQKVLTDPPDRITTGELFPGIEDLDTIQRYMMDKMKIMTSLLTNHGLKRFSQNRTEVSPWFISLASSKGVKKIFSGIITSAPG